MISALGILYLATVSSAYCLGFQKTYHQPIITWMRNEGQGMGGGLTLTIYKGTVLLYPRKWCSWNWYRGQNFVSCCLFHGNEKSCKKTIYGSRTALIHFCVCHPRMLKANRQLLKSMAGTREGRCGKLIGGDSTGGQCSSPSMACQYRHLPPFLLEGFGRFHGYRWLVGWHKATGNCSL